MIDSTAIPTTNNDFTGSSISNSSKRDKLPDYSSDLRTIECEMLLNAMNYSFNTNLDTITSIKLLTYNVGLLDVNIFGSFNVFSNPPHSDKRFPFIPIALLKEKADIIVLQECYEDYHANYLINKLKDMYPHHVRKESGGFIKFHNGLLIFSKWPIIDSALVSYEKVSLLESFMASKSFLIATIDIPSIGFVSIANIHTTAGGESDPEHPDVDTLRESELMQSIDYLRDLEKKKNHHVILMGDFNCGPDSSLRNYDCVLQNNFRDLFHEAVLAGVVDDSVDCFSWHPENYLNKNGPHAHTCPQRIDHIMVSSEDSFWEQWVVASAKITFTENVVPISLPDRISSTVSDHYGVLVELRR